jgi:glucokinase
VSETIGVDLGGTKMALGVLDEERNVLWESKERSTGQTEDELVEMLVREIDEARLARPAIVAAGLGIPATIDRRRGVAIASVNLPITDAPVRDLVAERTGLPVFVDNDANVAALAENLYGAAKGTRHAVMVTVGTGIGGGLIIDGELYRGSIGAAAELGHTVVELDGPRCQGYCPGRGCVEALASGTALGREGRRVAEEQPDSALGALAAQGEQIDGRTVTEAALAGDETAIAVVALVGRRLGAALTSFANIFNPEVIVVGGGVIAAGELLLAPAREEVRTRALAPMNATPVLAAELGPDAGMIGAAAMARIELGRESSDI